MNLMQRSNTVVETLLSKVSLVDLAERLDLGVTERSGSVKAVCPFHDDRSPSLVLYESVSAGDRPHYHCFACGAHGDIFHLTQQKLSKTFPEAVSWLANQYGVPLPNTRSIGATASPAAEMGQSKDGLQRALDIFAAHAAALTELSKLADERGFETSFLASAGVVIALPGVLKRSALDVAGHRQLLADLEAGGLLRARNDKNNESTSYHLNLNLWQEFFYDGRAIFPIKKESGEISGLAGRMLGTGPADAPKYLYTRAFKRAENLYRCEVAFTALLEEAKRLKRAKKSVQYPALDLYIVEGLFDALRLESLGYPAVSILGADLSSAQAEMISTISERLSVDFGVALHCHIFLDRDEAGIRGAAKALRMLLSKNVESDLIWTLNLDGKDPDELLGHCQSDINLRTFSHAPLLALLSDALGVTPSEILGYSGWDHISPQRFRTAAERIIKTFSQARPLQGSPNSRQTVIDILSRRCGEAPNELSWWIQQFLPIAASSTTSDTSTQGLYIEDLFARMDYARNLAWSSIQRGELPVDELAWRRIDRVSNLFNRGLVRRLADATDVPIDPFDTIYVPRGFDQPEHRTKSLPGPEDLVLQQYVLAELLSERFGSGYRNCIPAVRFSRRSKETITTGESKDTINFQTLSFAYQVDTDVLEGWSTPRESGIFRHYWDCWQDFIGALRSRTSRMDGKIHSVRLDLKRYYDNIERAWVRDILLPSVQHAANQDGISEKLAHALSISQGTTPGEIASRIVEWMLKQSFGYDFYDPVDGRVLNSAANVGLPQGPDLSAYLATIALFPVDRQMRSLLDRLNTDENSPHAVYVRYVDDIILVADSEQVLTQLRSELEDALRGTNLQAVNKHGPVRPMSKTAFAASLTEHRAFTASMPAPGFCLSPDGDGAAYFEDGLPENRSDALIVLNDPRLYFATRSAVLSGISAALAVHGELRHNEFVKAARWLWYLLSQHTYNSIHEAKSQFFALWQEAFGNTQIWNGIDVKERPWSDPAAYAIEGLDRLLSEKVLNWFRFTEGEKELIGQRLRRLADLVALPDIHCFFTPSPGEVAWPEGWGHGLQKRLNRMFIQRLGAIRGKSYLLLGQNRLLPWGLQDMSNDPNLSSSLRYLKIAIIESSGEDLISAHNRDGEISTWSNAFALLHEAIARLRSAESSEQDPIKGLGEFLAKSISATPELTRNIVEPLLLWFENDLRHSKPDVDTPIPVVVENRNTFQIALNSFVAATPARVLGELLSHRFHLLKQLCGGTDTPILAIPTIMSAPVEEKTPFLYFFCGTKLFALSRSETAPTTTFFEREWTKHQDSTLEISSWWIEPGSLHPKTSGSVSPVDVRAADVHKLGTTVRALIEQALILSSVAETDTKERPISAAHIYCSGEDAVRWDVVSDPVDGSLLGNRAFLRDGSAGLRSISVPLEDAWLWRIGVALTDYFGFADDLDHFAPLPASAAKISVELEEPLPAWHIMREGLYRLRGDLASKRPGVHNSNTLRFVPTGIFRLINQLERFPSDDLKDARLYQMAFLLAIMGETEAMRLRLSETWNLSQPGVVVGFFYHLASNILRYKLKAQWSDWLPHADGHASVMRRPISAVIALSSRIRKLPAPATACSSDSMAWHALLSGLDYVVATLAIRLTVVDLFVISDPDDVLTDSVHDWSCDGYFLPSRNSFDRNLLSEFRRATSGTGGNALLDSISPMGWATLLRALFESLAQKMSAEWADSLSKEQATLSREIDALIGRVSIQGSSQEDELLWPFDAGISSWITAEKEGESIQSLALTITARIDSAFGFRAVEKEDDHFSYRDQQFASTYHLPQWRLTNWWPDRQRESRLSGERYVYPWTEVWQSERLISVATSSAPLARLARPALASSADTNLTTEGSTPTAAVSANITTQSAVTAVTAPATSTAENIEHGTPLAPDEPPKAEHSRKSATERATGIRPGDAPPPLQQLQRRAWRDRSSEERNLQHVRVALFQWDLADTYRHPLVDCGIPPDIQTAIGVNDPTGHYTVTKNRRGDEHRFDRLCDRAIDDGAISLPSWAEHRRQQLLRSVITACAQFKVEVLVLPEYSVRPETILFIKNLLNDIEGAPAVYAGTYRMFGSTLPGRQREKLGLTASKTLDRQAILTLVERVSEKGEVTASTRSKRYPSAAANEFFSPSTNIRSLFLDRQNSPAGFDPLSVFIELVCSELFIATSPSNIYFLADEYEKLLTRFGHKSTRKQILTQVETDIREYANRTSFSRSREFWPRRSILVVPAMTSRSADYWLFGQSAMLSSSMTTVFCNAVSGKHSVGGSCFIGRASWHHDETGEALLVPTPYHGWSHGIFYSGKDDPLSPTEQALVIADIDPIHMAEGKPRPQSLSNPLQLVAYLPVIESLKNVPQTSSYACFEKVSAIASDLAKRIQEADGLTGVDLHNSLNAVVSDLDRLAEKCLDGKYFKRRTASWRNDSKEQPYFGGLPPALVDWLWVDLTPRVTDGVPEIPKLLVPPWAS
jgi:DNA primase catalytic core